MPRGPGPGTDIAPDTMRPSPFFRGMLGGGIPLKTPTNPANLSPLPCPGPILSSFPPATRGAHEASGGKTGPHGVDRAEACMPTTGRSTEATGDRRRWMFRHPGQRSALSTEGMSTRKGAARGMRPKSRACEAAFASSLLNLGAKAASHRVTARPHGSGASSRARRARFPQWGDFRGEGHCSMLEWQRHVLMSPCRERI